MGSTDPTQLIMPSPKSMTAARTPYPKFLAFLQSSYPVLFRQIVPYATKADLVETKLICANNSQNFHALVFSDGRYAQGDRFEIRFEGHAADLSSWDWRWVFALQIRYQDAAIFPLHFRQHIIALPQASRPLSSTFFGGLVGEFSTPITQWISTAEESDQPISQSYLTYIETMTEFKGVGNK
jgi:hypothetical protein